MDKKIEKHTGKVQVSIGVYGDQGFPQFGVWGGPFI